MSSPTIHTVGLRGIVAPWAVGVAFKGRVTVQAGPGAERWAEDFRADHVGPTSILPGDWPEVRTYHRPHWSGNGVAHVPA